MVTFEDKLHPIAGPLRETIYEEVQNILANCAIVSRHPDGIDFQSNGKDALEFTKLQDVLIKLYFSLQTAYTPPRIFELSTSVLNMRGRFKYILEKMDEEIKNISSAHILRP